MVPGILKKMVENVLGEFCVAANLHHFAYTVRLRVINVPAKIFLIFIPDNDLAKFSASRHAVHEAEKPFQGNQIVFRPDGIAGAEFSEALKQGFDIKICTVHAWRGSAEGIEGQVGGKVIGESAERFRDKL